MLVYTSYWPPSEKMMHSCQCCRICPRVGELALVVSCRSIVGISLVSWCSVVVPAVLHTGLPGAAMVSVGKGSMLSWRPNNI